MEAREVQEKAYCCSNYPHTEANLIAKFDLVVGAIGLLFAIIYISVVAAESPQPVANTQNQANLPSQNVTNDISLFMYWPRESKLVFMSFSLVWRVLDIAFSIVLFIGVKWKKHGYLLIWFIFTTFSVTISVISGIVSLILASERLLLGIFIVVPFLYNWYCLWIVKLLMSELRAIREGYSNPLDDGEIENANNLVPSSDSFTVDKF